MNPQNYIRGDMLASSVYDSQPPSDVPSMTNAYQSDYWTTSRDIERQLGERKWNDSKNPFQTGVVPRPTYASQFSGSGSESVGIESAGSDSVGSGSGSVQTLAGVSIPATEFMHNNMQPFFRGSVKQNISTFANESRLENMTGRGDLFLHKKEVECFFEPTAGFDNVCGMGNKSDFYQDRLQLITPKARNNDLPFEQVRVGRGLAQGFTSEPSGGFQQASTLDYARPKNVDELRVATNPRIVYELPIQGPGKAIGQRGLIGAFAKNRPDTAFEHTHDMLFKTTGAVLKDTERPVIDVKPTARVESHVEYTGSSGNGAGAGTGSSFDYGLSGLTVPSNERESTQGNTVVTNLVSSVKSIIAPLLDIFKHGIKEYNIESARTFGNMQAQIPDKPTTYDPVTHAMRTTIKETLIHDTTTGALTGAEKPVAAFTDSAKTTVRETLPIEETTRNIGVSTYRVTVYNVDAMAKKTVRETTPESSSQLGFISGDANDIHPGAYDYIKVDLHPTQKQFISDYEYEGVAKSTSDFRTMSDEYIKNAEIDPTRDVLNKAAGYTPNGGGEFTSLDPSNIDLSARKLVSDSIAPRANAGNVTRVMQTEVTPIKQCDLTKPAMKDINVTAVEDRLDSSVLGGLKSNPFALSINPF